jgi:hypothetical protein
MSYYGAIPIEKTYLLVQNYSIANPLTWQFEKANKLYGGVEDNIFSEAQKQEIQNLDGVWFASAAEFLEWLNNE